MKKINFFIIFVVVTFGFFLKGCDSGSLTDGLLDGGEQAAMPVFSQPGGTYTQNISLEISCATSGALIYYTTDGNTPNEGSTLYSDPVVIDSDGANVTLRAIAYVDGMKASDITTAVYAINYPPVVTPTFNIGDGTYSSDQNVSISSETSDVTIYYTISYSASPPADPTTSSDEYSGPISIAGDGTVMTIKAIAVKDQMKNSSVATITVTIDYAALSTPQFKVGGLAAGSSYDYDVSVAIEADAGATIYYTISNSSTPPADPTIFSDEYSAPINVSGDGTVKTIKAFAVQTGYLDSEIVTRTITIDYPDVPLTFSASDGESTSSINLTWNVVSGYKYIIYRDIDNDPEDANILDASGIINSPYPDSESGLVQDTTYYYWIQTCSETTPGCSELSSPETGYLKLSAPTGLTASDGTSESSIELTWNTVDQANKYTVMYNAENSFETASTLAFDIIAGNYNHTGASPGRFYYYWIVAEGDLDNSTSGPSNFNKGHLKMSAPETFSAYEYSTGDIRIYWSSELTSVDTYYLYRSTTSTRPSSAWQSTNGTTNDYYDSGPGYFFYYWIRSYDSTTVSYSDFKMTTGCRELSVVKNLTASDGTFSDGVHLSWSGVSGAVSYDVCRNVTNSLNTNYCQNTGSLTPSAVDGEGDPGVTYYYWVRARSRGSSCHGDYSSSDSGYY